MNNKCLFWNESRISSSAGKNECGCKRANRDRPPLGQDFKGSLHSVVPEMPMHIIGWVNTDAHTHPRRPILWPFYGSNNSKNSGEEEGNPPSPIAIDHRCMRCKCILIESKGRTRCYHSPFPSQTPRKWGREANGICWLRSVINALASARGPCSNCHRTELHRSGPQTSLFLSLHRNGGWTTGWPVKH